MEVIVVFSAVLALTAAGTEFSSVNNAPTLQSIIANCLGSNDTMTCLSVKSITALNRAVQIEKTIEIFPGISIRRHSTMSARSATPFSENEIIQSLPPEGSERSGRLFDLALDSLANFVDSHSLEVRFPRVAIDRAVEEGRTIKKKHMSALALAIALKALILAKLALASKFCQGGHKGGHYTEWINRSF